MLVTDRRRVIFVNRVYWPSETATAQLLTDLAEALAAKGWRIEVIAAGTGPAEHNGVLIHRTGPGEVHEGMRSRIGNYVRFVRQCRRQLRTLLRPGDFVVSMTDPPLLSLATKMRGSISIHWLQDLYPEIAAAHAGIAARIALWPLRWIRNRSWRDAASLVCVGADMPPLLRANGIRPEFVHLIPNWAPRELEHVPDAGAIAARRNEWQLSNRFVVAYSGNLGRVHEFDTVISAAEILRDDARIAFLFVGDGPRLAEVRRAVAARALSNIRFLPFQRRADLAVSLAASDVHLVTLRPGFEQFASPSKLAGALAAGRPVLFVGPPNSELARTIQTGKCGLAVAPGDAMKLAAAVRTLRDETEWRQEAGANARSTYDRDYRLGVAIDRWERVLADVLRQQDRVAIGDTSPQTEPPP